MAIKKSPPKPKPSRRSISEDKLIEAKRMYMEYIPVIDIAKAIEENRTTISYYVQTYWRPEREMMKADLFAHFSEVKRTNFIKMSASSMEIIQRALHDLAKRDMPPTVTEAKKATEILESLDKITRLDDGNPTEIMGEKPMSFKDIEVIANLNPFKNKEIPDADFNELDPPPKRK